ncbi:hypothetical protein EMB92_10225 [Bifidobacterium callitrichos]|uniref:Uncharacterized protein n=2 Tax=Bifidobacterium callitrichos TaxID=762209 RepID=A0A5M9ZB92_9BIFI|nr:hypothetical protein EMB92_10225 [Bifidobacterium callitrichos]
MRGVVTPIFGLLAVAAIALGLLNATVWQPSRTITADAKVTGTRYIVTDPDVLGLVDDRVTITADGGSGTVCVAIASSKDATGWLAGHPYTRLTGLSDWTTLSTERASAGTGQSGSQSDSGDSGDSGDEDVAFADSDMWRSVQCGDGSTEIKATSSAVTDVALVDLGEGGDSADVSFTWTRKTLPDYSTPMYFLGGLLVVLAILTASVFAMPPHKRRKRVVESDPIPAREEEVSIAEAFTGSLNAIKPSFTPKSSGRPRRRHAVGSDTSSSIPVVRIEGESGTGTQPVVVDPSSRNLVADAGASATPAPTTPEPQPEPVDDSATSVISQDELQAYFARLAREVGEESTSGDDNGDDGKGKE